MRRVLIELSPEIIDDIFEKESCKGSNMYKAFFAIYQFLVPEFRKGISHGHIAVSSRTANHIVMRLNLMSENLSEVNLLWLNRGFFIKEVPDWTADLSEFKINT